MKFTDGVKVRVDGLAKEKNGLSYLNWAAAMRLAKLPNIKIVHFDGLPFLPIFGGAAVAVDLENPDHCCSRVWLPVLDHRNKPIPIDQLSPRNINDAIATCRTKAIALGTGVGMSLYAGFGMNVAGFLKTLAVRPDSDLMTVPPLSSTKGQRELPYVNWAAAYTACKITDPDFTFEVGMYDVLNPNTGEIVQRPYQQLPNGWAVSVKVNYHDRSHIEILPIMDAGNNPLVEPSSFDWNKAIMRCMTKAVAVCTGYGLTVYAQEELQNFLNGREPIQRKEQPTVATPANDAPAVSTQPQQNPNGAVAPSSRQDRVQIITSIRQALEAKGRTEAELLRYLGVSQPLDQLHDQALETALRAVH